MTNNPATLNITTPDRNRPTPPMSMLDRCAKLGAAAYLFDAQASLVASSDPGAVGARLSAWMNSAPILERVRAVVARMGQEGKEFEQSTLFPGCELVVIAHKEGTMAAGFTSALLMAPEAMGAEEFLEGCRAVGLDMRAVAKEALPLARYGGAAAGLMSKALRSMGTDLEQIEDQRVALEGFTHQLTDSYDTMDLLYSVGRSMREPGQPEQFLSFVCERLFATMSFGWVGIRFSEDAWIASGLRGRVVVRGEIPVTESEFRAVTLPLISQPAFPRVLEKMALCAKSASGHQVLSQPLMCKGKPVGVLVTGGKFGADPDVSSYDIQLIEAAGGYINAFSDNVALYEDQHNLFMGTVQALTAAIDAKDRYTFGHSERVAHLASELAIKAGMTRIQAERIRIAGLVHDVGKIGVPEAVLCKQGKLTAEEYEAIKKHPEIGFTILRDIALLSDVLPGVLHHHERYDGKGYPHGLAGEAIPKIARILAVADTFDAMSSTRSYRAAMPREKVLAEIARCAGTQLDAELAKLFSTVDLTEYDRLVSCHAAGHMPLAA